MKILLINDHGSCCGGAENYVFNLIAALKDSGHDVRLFSSDTSLHNQPLAADYMFKINSRFKNRTFGKLKKLFNITAYFLLRKVIKEFRPDVVHIHMFLWYCSPAVLLAIKGAPVFITLHEYGFFCPTLMKFIIRNNSICTCKPGLCCVKNGCVHLPGLLLFLMQRWLVFKMIDKVKCWLPPSSYPAGLLTEIGITNYKVLPYGFDLDQYPFIPVSSRPASKKILFLGRIDLSKGGMVLVEAFNLLLKEMPDAQLLIVGEGTQKKSLEEKVKELNISPWVEFRGWAKSETIGDLHRSVNLLVAPSLWPDNLPLVICESMLWGTPVLASRVGGIPDLLGGIEGCLFRAGAYFELAKAMESILTDSAVAEKISITARAKAENMLDCRKHIDEIVHSYTEK
ncbi:MAG: glycosyltransferase family 4 protein [Fibrobacter sp.]|nr:glycosyltransferase family 4 protein [Fibrobacter sp.]